MSPLKSWPNAGKIDLLSPTHRLRPKAALMAANMQALARLAPSTHASQDVRGQTLRRLRTQQERDPAMLATQACISLKQLYQLESGESSLFYNPSLRNQAGRRIASLLGVCWDQLSDAPVPAGTEKHLKLVASQTAPIDIATAVAG